MRYMAARTGTAHVVTTIRKYKDRVYRTHLLRRSYREGGSVKNETLGNLSHLPDDLVEIVRRALQGETFVPLGQAFEVLRSPAHGHAQAVTTAMQRLGFASLIASKPCRERDLVLTMVAARILAPHTKLATTRWWHTTTLAEDFDVADANEDHLYAAMDWLLQRQNTIQKKLAARHLSAGGLVLYDLSSSYFEGTTCPLAQRGYNRDGKRGVLQVNYGLLTDARGRPVAVSVHEGNTSDSRTFMPEVQRLRQDFGIERMVMVGDRGMIGQKAIDQMRDTDGIGWITALKSASIRSLIEQGQQRHGIHSTRESDNNTIASLNTGAMVRGGFFVISAAAPVRSRAGADFAAAARLKAAILAICSGVSSSASRPVGCWRGVDALRNSSAICFDFSALACCAGVSSEASVLVFAGAAMVRNTSRRSAVSRERRSRFSREVRPLS